MKEIKELNTVFKALDPNCGLFKFKEFNLIETTHNDTTYAIGGQTGEEVTYTYHLQAKFINKKEEYFIDFEIDNNDVLLHSTKINFISFISKTIEAHFHQVEYSKVD